MTIAASADSYVRSDLVNNNYGTSTTLYTDAANATSPDMRTFLKFDLSGQPLGRTIESAVLEVATAAAPLSGSAGTMDFKLAPADSWAETDLTWSNAPTAGTTIGSLSNTTSGEQYSVNLDTSAVQNAVGRSLALQIDTTSTDALALNSKEGSVAAPTL
ncbi:MAG: DNRLRE domain-containing protein, partial [Nocardioidaceae bacterium]